jgi:ketopantoate reductase
MACSDINQRCSIGSFYAFILSRNENVRLSVVARSNYEAVKANGFKIVSENHGEHTVKPFQGEMMPQITAQLHVEMQP